MTLKELSELWEECEEHQSDHERPANSYFAADDLNAFMLLWKLSEGPKKDVIADASHDQIWLSFDPERVAKVITQDQVEELVACGVHLDVEDVEGFYMFV